MPADRFVSQLNAQITHELGSSHQYLACAAYYDALTLPQMAGFFYRQAAEERDHALMMIRYLLDTGAPVEIGATPAVVCGFADVVEPVALALEAEQKVTAQINDLYRTAREEVDFASEQFMGWFIREQVEETATMSDLLAVVTRNRDDVEQIEEYVDRNLTASAPDPTAPAIAGA